MMIDFRFGRRLAAVAASALALAFAPQASASALYTNGSLVQIHNGYPIYEGTALSNSFTLTQRSRVDGVSFGSIFDPESKLLTVDWGISSLPDHAPIDGMAAVSNTLSGSYFGCSCLGIYITKFSIDPIVLDPGTYYLSLQNAVVSDKFGNIDPHYPAYWGVNSGPSSARRFCPSCNTGGKPSESEFFEVLGEGVPEPATWAMLVGGFSLAGWALRRRRAIAFG